MIYLDNNTTSKLHPKILKTMMPYLKDNYGVRTCFHEMGVDADVAVQRARGKVASFLGVKPKQVYFTSGTTESNNWVIRNIVDNCPQVHIITSNISDDSIYNTLKYFEDKNLIEITEVKFDKTGRIDLKEFEDSFRSNTRLVMFSLANGITGISTGFYLDKIFSISKICKKNYVELCWDATQMVGRSNSILGAIREGCDYLIFSTHRFHGPKGIGVLYVKDEQSINPLLFGSGQENGKRSGSENVSAIVGCGEICSILCKYSFYSRLDTITSFLYKELNVLDLEINVIRGSLVNTLLIFLLNKKHTVDGFLDFMAQNGICMSAVSSCSLGLSVGSRVLKSLDYPENGIIISLGLFNTKREMKKVVKKFKEYFSIKRF